MKKLFIGLLAVSLFSFNGNAQIKRDVTQSQKMRSDTSRHFKKGQMMNDLNLTADQKAKMKEIQQSGKEQRDAIRNDASLTQEQKMAKMKDLRKSQSEKVNSILTPDQRAKRKASMEKMRSNSRMHGTKGFNRKHQNSDSPQDKSQS
jgi:Spy/CpxP family protein refolding chaperone